MSAQRNVLVIYTGGTIGMIKNAETGTLAPFDFTQLQKQIPEINQLSASVSTLSFEKPIDSSNMGLEHWQKLAGMIAVNYDDYDGFVILHGSDTMAFTASALSFMLQNLSKPIILTGSQLPIGVVRTDGKENFITSIEIASSYAQGKAMVPEVAIYFEYQLYRGNRTYKYNAEHFEAFRSPNYPQLAKAGVHIKYNSEHIRPSLEKLRLDTRMDNHVAVLTLFPGMSPAMVRAGLQVAENKVLIMRTYGSGNAMTHPWFLDALEDAIKSGLIIINVSQCRGGGVSQGRYETSKHLAGLGVLSGGDMIIEAAITKAMHLLAVSSDLADFKRWFTTDLRGELTAVGNDQTA